MDIYIKKADTTISIDENRFSPAVHDYIFEYGLSRKLGNSIGPLNSGATQASMVARINVAIAQLYAGDIMARTPRARYTEIERFALDLARKKVMGVWKQAHPNGHLLRDYKSASADAMAEYNSNKMKYDEAAAITMSLFKT